MHVHEYQTLASRSAKELPLHKAILHIVTGLAGEVGELSDAIKKAEVYEKPYDMENISEEIGDLLWFLAYAANTFGFSLETIARQNIEKLATRYPEGYSDYHAAKRLDKGEA
jgi:NTP pyrophosphatase (non-canonical NTP hydrolase)